MKRRRNVGWIPVSALKIVKGLSAGRDAIEFLFRHNGGDVTDRALRYRAVKNAPPKAPCYWCGRKRQKNGRSLEVAHINGLEEDDSPENLGWTCRGCNVVCGRVLKQNGLGRATHQYNPAKRRAPQVQDGGAQTLGAWVNAVLSMKGEPGGDMSVSDAVELIRNTPAIRRSRFAHEIWKRRPRRSDVPF